MKPKMIVIVGPTAAGKSGFAVRLAKEHGGEVISADSRQVYRGLDIGTGKITKREMRGVRHHLLDVADPKRPFTAARYVELARKAIEDISRRGKTPIVCGGTGFYVSALLDDVSLSPVPPDQKLRARLAGKGPEALMAILKRSDPDRWRVMDSNFSDKKNARRIIRAIEIAAAQKGSRGKKRETAGFSHASTSTGVYGQYLPNGAVPSLRHKYDISMIGVKVPPAELKKRIRARLLKRIRGGMIDEAGGLHRRGLSWKRMDELGLEYRYMALYLRGKLTKKEMLDKLNTEIWRYAKRQITWWRKDKRTKWIRMPK